MGYQPTTTEDNPSCCSLPSALVQMHQSLLLTTGVTINKISGGLTYKIFAFKYVFSLQTILTGFANGGLSSKKILKMLVTRCATGCKLDRLNATVSAVLGMQSPNLTYQSKYTIFEATLMFTRELTIKVTIFAVLTIFRKPQGPLYYNHQQQCQRQFQTFFSGSTRLFNL